MMIETEDCIWSITYGGDEPLTHPLYRKMLNSVMLLCVNDGIEVEITTHRDINPIRCTISYYQHHSDHIVVRDIETERVHAIMIEDIHNIHIC